MKISRKRLFSFASVFALILSGAYSASAQETPPDLMSFANGALPISVNTGDGDMRVEIEHAIAIIDGNPTGFVATRKWAADGDAVEIIYELPAATQFSRFAVPNVLETPSPSQTFFKSVEVSGSAIGVDGPYSPLASTELATHDRPGMLTELAMVESQSEVRWVKLRLSGGVNVETEKSFLEFSELIGNGTQASSARSDQFSGVWRGRGVKIELAQDGASVTGCYDSNSELSGTVDGRVLRALGADEAGIASQFILIADDDGEIQGLRSTNGAPFKTYNGAPSDHAPICLPPEPAKLGCGSVIHGIGFDYDSADIREASQPIITSLYEGLFEEDAVSIEIVGHSSSEGSEDYNRDLSQRRAQAVVSALIALGIEPSTLSASGQGELDPIASNDDEAGRSLNRRVEIECAD